MTAAVAVVIVTYRSEQTIGMCLRALAAAGEGVALRAFVVDNSSDDFTLDAARDAQAAIAGSVEVEIVARHSNDGFAAGSNIGMERALADEIDFVLFCNPDAILPPGAVRTLAEAARAWPRNAIVSPALVNLDGSPQPMVERTYHLGRTLAGMVRIGGANRPTPAPPGGAPFTADWVHGAVLLISVDLLRRLEGWDAGYFLYAEDMDLCVRARSAGADVVVVPEVRVPHISGASALLSGGEPFRAADRVHGMGRFLSKEHGWWATAVFAVATSLTSVPAAVVKRSRGNESGAEVQWAKARAAARLLSGRGRAKR